jgi:hypothetical protein
VLLGQQVPPQILPGQQAWPVASQPTVQQLLPQTNWLLGQQASVPFVSL